ncbi:MAG: ABC transporter permease [Bacillota bacterium]
MSIPAAGQEVTDDVILRRASLKGTVREIGALLALIVLCIGLSILSPHFLKFSNIMNVLRQVSIIAIVAVGMTFVIISAGIDLSVGSVLSLSSVLMATLIVNHAWPAYPAFLAGLVLGGALGYINGILITRINLPPFIATLGMMSVARGLSYVYTDGAPIYGLPSGFRFLGEGMIGPVPLPVVLMLVVYAAAYVVLNRTRLGRYCYAIGGNEEAAILSGIPISRYKMVYYAGTGVLAALGGSDNGGKA